MTRMRWAVASVLALGLLGCCEQRRVDLLLDLRTDLVPGVEFLAVRTERFGSLPTSAQTATGSAREVSEAQRGDDFITGQRIAVFRRLAPGRHAVRVRLIGPDGQPFLQRIVLITVQRTSVFTIVMTRDCRDVTCPAAGDDPSATECLNGRCVRPECTPETLESCPSFSCEVGVTCIAAAACADPQCTSEGVCLRAQGAGCVATQYCDPELGCQPLPDLPDGGALMDAGTPPPEAIFAAYLKPSNTSMQQFFGSSVALSADGSTLAVSAATDSSAATGINGDQSDQSAPGSGAVYVFVRNGNAWTQQAYVKASNTDAGDEFGSAEIALGNAVALSADGSTLAVGAYSEDSAATGIDGNQANNAAQNSGAVYVFTRSGGIWSQQAYIKASNAQAMDEFGSSVALSADGSTLAVQAHLEDSSATGVNGNGNDNLATDSGAVYVFSRTGSTWSQQAYIKASNTSLQDRFGVVALSGDGSSLAVGTQLEDSPAEGIDGDQGDSFQYTNSGAAYVFSRTGSTWSQQAYIKASNTTTAARNGRFGNSVALSADGLILTVGALRENSGATGVQGDQSDLSAVNGGAVYVFVRTGSAWSQQAYIKSFNTDPGDAFGVSVGLSADGSLLAVGALGEDSAASGIDGDPTDNSFAGSGAAYTFLRNGGTWTPHSYFKALNPDAGDGFGRSIALSANGMWLALGARREDSAAIGVDGDRADNSVTDSGAVYLYAF